MYNQQIAAEAALENARVATVAELDEMVRVCGYMARRLTATRQELVSAGNRAVACKAKPQAG